jgi:isopenicillin N synthase-like dioxygenase
VEHRALTNKKAVRMSIACFYGPDENDTVAPIDLFVSDDKPMIYRETRFGDYIKHGFGKKLDGKANLEFCRKNPSKLR